VPERLREAASIRSRSLLVIWRGGLGFAKRDPLASPAEEEFIWFPVPVMAIGGRGLTVAAAEPGIDGGPLHPTLSELGRSGPDETGSGPEVSIDLPLPILKLLEPRAFDLLALRSASLSLFNSCWVLICSTIDRLRSPSEKMASMVVSTSVIAAKCRYMVTGTGFFDEVRRMFRLVNQTG
jgi:hypothetical protein